MVVFRNQSNDSGRRPPWGLSLAIAVVICFLPVLAAAQDTEPPEDADDTDMFSDTENSAAGQSDTEIEDTSLDSKDSEDSDAGGGDAVSKLPSSTSLSGEQADTEALEGPQATNQEEETESSMTVNDEISLSDTDSSSEMSAVNMSQEEEDLLGMSLAELLDTPITTASGGISETRRISPATVTIITKQDIKQNGWRSLAELLAYVPGLHVIDNYTTPTLSVRGMNGGLRAGTRIVKIMINSVPVNFRPDLTAFLGSEFIPIEVIEQVEVVKGPLSALYGANAFLATINIITKTAESGLKHELAGRTTWQQSSGSAGYGGSIMTSYGSEHFDFVTALSSDHWDRSGLEIPQTFDAQSSDPARFPYFDETSKNDVSRPTSAWTKLDAKFTEDAVLTAQAGFQEMDAGGEYVLNSVQTHENRINLYNFWSDLSYSQRWTDSFSSQLSVGGSHGEPSSDMRLVLPSDQDYFRIPKYEYSALNLGGSVRLDLTWLNVKIGGDFEHNHEHSLWYHSVPFSPATAPDPTAPPETIEYNIRSGGMYAAVTGQPLYKKLPGLKVSGNIRLDRLSYDGNTQPWEHSWRLASTYSHNDRWAVKIFGGRSFQGPSGVLLYAQPGLQGFGQGNNIIGQMNLVESGQEDEPLKPQVAKSVEAAGSIRLWESIHLEASVFYQQVEDTIKFVPYAGNFLAQNVGKSKFFGAEGTLRGVFFGRFSPAVTWSYIRPLDAEEEVIPFYPNWQVFSNLGLSIPEAYMCISVLGKYISERGASDGNVVQNISRYYTLDAYGDIDVTLSSTELYLLSDTAETVLTLSGRNLIGKTHSEPGYGGFDYPSPGRIFFFELRQRF